MSIIPQAGFVFFGGPVIYGPLYAPGAFQAVPPPVDLDQGGTFRQFERVYLGQGIGWIRAPVESVLNITTAGTFFVDPSYTIVAVNVAGAVTVLLPSTKPNAAGAQAVPGQFVDAPLTIVDTGGNALAHPITIVAAGSEGISGFATISITVNNGSYTLQPIPVTSQPPAGWTIAGKGP